MSETVTPARRRLQRRKREAQVGLANNAFGAAAGAAATGAVYAQQRRTLRAAKKPPVDEWAAKFPTRPAPKAVKASFTERALKKLKVNPKFVLPAVAGVAVGSQVANGAMDAQSAQYFGRELKTLHDKEKRMEARVHKSYEEITVGTALPDTDGVGRNLELVEKKVRRFDPEADRQRRLGAYEGASAATAVGLGVGGAVAAKKIKSADWAIIRQGGKLVKVPAALLAGSAVTSGLALGAHRRAKSARNERWT